MSFQNVIMHGRAYEPFDPIGGDLPGIPRSLSINEDGELRVSIIKSEIPTPQNTSLPIFPENEFEIETQSGVKSNTYGKGANFYFNIVEIVSGNWVVSIEGHDPTSNSEYTILDSIAFDSTHNGLYILQVYPGISEIPNQKISDIIPLKFRVRVTPTGVLNPSTFGMTADIIV